MLWENFLLKQARTLHNSLRVVQKLRVQDEGVGAKKSQLLFTFRMKNVHVKVGRRSKKRTKLCPPSYWMTGGGNWALISQCVNMWSSCMSWEEENKSRKTHSAYLLIYYLISLFDYIPFFEIETIKVIITNLVSIHSTRTCF